MNLRNYNIYFHTHTISGIIISLVLYVIFFAGSFAFFRSQISHWQHNEPSRATVKKVDYNRMADTVSKAMDLYGRDVSFYTDAQAPKIYFYTSESKDTTQKTETEYFTIDAENFSRAKGDYEQSYDLGEFLYRLHFLAQIPYPYGYYLAGGVAFIFLFALITGLLVHWQKIVSNFYVFRPWEKLKTLWTDLHTALGVIAFPFMLIFAITGASFLIAYPLFHDPVVKYRFNGSEDSLAAQTGEGSHNIALTGQRLTNTIHFNDFADKGRQIWGDSVVINHVEAINYGDKSMQVHVGGIMNPSVRFAGGGELVFNAEDGKILRQTDPDSPVNYSTISNEILYRLHFANYGGMATKLLYFVLGIACCFVIISGIMIWLIGRDKNSVPEHKRKFNNWLVNIYLSISLGMLPVTALSFIAVKFRPDGGMSFVYTFYFITWLVVSGALIALRDIHKTNRLCLLTGAVLGFAVPVVNGIVTGNWIWNSFLHGYRDVLLIDLLWLSIAAVSLYAWLRLRRTSAKPHTTVEKKVLLQQA